MTTNQIRAVSCSKSNKQASSEHNYMSFLIDTIDNGELSTSNHLLSEVKDENRKLGGDNKHLEAVCDFFTKIELRLRDGHVITIALIETSTGDDSDDDYLSVLVDSGPMPLSAFRSGKVSMLGQNIGLFPGDNHLALGIRRNGAILLRFALSNHCAVDGILQGLSNEDYSRLKKRTFVDTRPITQYLKSGLGLHNPAAIAFIPTVVVFDISSELRSTLKLLGPLPSREDVKNSLVEYLRNPRAYSYEIPHLLLPGFTSSDVMRTSIVAALGQSDSQAELLTANFVLKNESSCLMQIQEMIASVKVCHPAFDVRLSLTDGTLHRGPLVWGIGCTVKVRQGCVTNYNICSLAMFHSGMRLKMERLQTSVYQTGALFNFTMTFVGGLMVSGIIHNVTSECIDMIYVNVGFPLSSVQNILDLLGVDAS